MNAIGENIARLRRQKEMTQEALADDIGVSAQSVSRWENGTTMPDIMLLPVISDIFGVKIDDLFKTNEPFVPNDPNKAVELCTDALLDTMYSCMHDTHFTEPYDSLLAMYKEQLANDIGLRTAMMLEDGMVYYREPCGGVILKRPKGHQWYELFEYEFVEDILLLLADRDFRKALAYIITTNKNLFTIASICRGCDIREPEALKGKLDRSKLFVEQKIEGEDKEISVYSCISTTRIYMLFVILTYAAEYVAYLDMYTGFYGGTNLSAIN